MKPFPNQDTDIHQSPEAGYFPSEYMVGIRLLRNAPKLDEAIMLGQARNVDILCHPWWPLSASFFGI
jgi:hypothetical protein